MLTPSSYKEALYEGELELSEEFVWNRVQEAADCWDVEGVQEWLSVLYEES